MTAVEEIAQGVKEWFFRENDARPNSARTGLEQARTLAGQYAAAGFFVGVSDKYLNLTKSELRGKTSGWGIVGSAAATLALNPHAFVSELNSLEKIEHLGIGLLGGMIGGAVLAQGYQALATYLGWKNPVLGLIIPAYLMHAGNALAGYLADHDGWKLADNLLGRSALWGTVAMAGFSLGHLGVGKLARIKDLPVMSSLAAMSIGGTLEFGARFVGRGLQAATGLDLAAGGPLPASWRNLTQDFTSSLGTTVHGLAVFHMGNRVGEGGIRLAGQGARYLYTETKQAWPEMKKSAMEIRRQIPIQMIQRSDGSIQWVFGRHDPTPPWQLSVPTEPPNTPPGSGLPADSKTGPTYIEDLRQGVVTLLGNASERRGLAILPNLRRRASAILTMLEDLITGPLAGKRTLVILTTPKRTEQWQAALDERGEGRLRTSTDPQDVRASCLVLPIDCPPLPELLRQERFDLVVIDDCLALAQMGLRRRLASVFPDDPSQGPAVLGVTVVPLLALTDGLAAKRAKVICELLPLALVNQVMSVGKPQVMRLAHTAHEKGSPPFRQPNDPPRSTRKQVSAVNTTLISIYPILKRIAEEQGKRPMTLEQREDLRTPHLEHYISVILSTRSRPRIRRALRDTLLAPELAADRRQALIEAIRLQTKAFFPLLPDCIKEGAFDLHLSLSENLHRMLLAAHPHLGETGSAALADLFKPIAERPLQRRRQELILQTMEATLCRPLPSEAGEGHFSENSHPLLTPDPLQEIYRRLGIGDYKQAPCPEWTEVSRRYHYYAAQLLQAIYHHLQAQRGRDPVYKEDFLEAAERICGRPAVEIKEWLSQLLHTLSALAVLPPRPVRSGIPALDHLAPLARTIQWERKNTKERQQVVGSTLSIANMDIETLLASVLAAVDTGKATTDEQALHRLLFGSKDEDGAAFPQGRVRASPAYKAAKDKP